MRRLLLSISLALLAPAAPLLAVDGDWRTLGPDGGPVYDLAFQPGNPQVLYATVLGGVYKSTDGGATWAWSGSGLLAGSQTLSLGVDPFHPFTVYVAQGAGVYKSVNAGSTWRYTGPGASRIAVHPRVSGTILAATYSGLLRSTDGAATWQRLTRGFPRYYQATTVLFDPTSKHRFYAAIEDEDTGEERLFRSLDDGATWRPLPASPRQRRQIAVLAVDPRSAQTLYAGTNAGLYKSADGGRSWRSASLSGFIWSVAVHPRRSEVVYAGTSEGLFRSRDGGASWARLPQVMTGPGGVFAVVFSPASAKTLYATVGTIFERAGVYKSVDGGSSWTFGSRGIQTLFISSIAVDPQDSETLWIIGNDVPFKSTDRGRTWVRVRPGPGAGDVHAAQVAVDPRDGSTVYLSLTDGSLRRTRDGGGTWEAAGNPQVAPTGNAVLVFDPQQPATLYAAGIGIAKSTDSGATWKPLSGEPADMVFWQLAVAPSSPMTLYGSGGGGLGGPRVVRSTDGGQTWTRVQNGLPSNLVALAVDPLLSTTVYGVPHETGGNIYKTDDGGAHWSLFTGAFQDKTVQPLAASPFTSGLLYAGVWFDNVYELQDGDAWEPLGKPPYRAVYVTLAVDPGDPCRIYAGTADRGLLAFTKSGCR